MEASPSPLDSARVAYAPRLAAVLDAPPDRLTWREGHPTSALADVEAIRGRFPRTFGRPLLEAEQGGGPGPATGRALAVGVVFSGGQASGGHNVVAGLLDGLLATDARARLIGFRDGPRGVLEGKTLDLPPSLVAGYRNLGGFDLLGSGRDKIETPEQFEAARASCERLGLDGLIIVGGDDSNTNAALLAEHFLTTGCRTSILGVPKTIDGDLKGTHVECSFGFDTATKVYAELIGNISRDARSSRKYWHFVRLMGRSASHVTLECAFLTRPNVTLIGEEVQATGQTLGQIADQVAGIVKRRAESGLRHGVLLLPEGLIEFVPEMRALIGTLNSLLAGELASAGPEELERRASEALAPDARTLFMGLPERIRRQLLIDRDAHGNVQVSQIDSEELLIELVRARTGTLSVQGHFFGYEGRAGQPTNFDADYTYGLGRVAAALVAAGRTGYLCSLRGLVGPAQSWRAQAVPLTSMMRLEQRKGKQVPVIGKALVAIDGAPFRALAEVREDWAANDRYAHPGPIQYFGPPEVCDSPPVTLALEHPAKG